MCSKIGFCQSLCFFFSLKINVTLSKRFPPGGEGRIRTAAGNLAKGMQPRFFSTKGILGWSGIVTNLEMQAECLQIEANRPCGRGLLLMAQKSLSLLHVLYEEQNNNSLKDNNSFCLFWGEGGGKGAFVTLT